MIRMAMAIVVLIAAAQFSFSKDQRMENYILGLKETESNILLGYISQEADNNNVDVIVAAMRRVGELKLTNFRKIVSEKIDTWGRSAEVSGSANSFWQQAFNEAVRTLGKLSYEPKDADRLLFRYKDIRVATTRFCIIEALGNMVGVSNAIAALNDIANSPLLYLTQDGVPDKRLISKLLDAIEAQNHKSSAVPIGKWGGNFRIGPDLEDKRSKILNEILKTGNDWPKSE